MLLKYLHKNLTQNHRPPVELVVLRISKSEFRHEVTRSEAKALTISAQQYQMTKIPMTKTLCSHRLCINGFLVPVLNIGKFEPQKRAHSPQLAAGLASESENSKLPYGRRFPAACCGELQFRICFEFRVSDFGFNITQKCLKRYNLFNSHR